jgi:hypothetical protein
MKKTISKRLTVSATTLRLLSAPMLDGVVGGLTALRVCTVSAVCTDVCTDTCGKICTRTCTQTC